MVYSDEKEQIRKKLFLPLFYTVISLLVPLSLWAAWGIYRQPLRYRSLFPHNEARRQAIAVCLLTVLFFLPFFQLWINEKILILIGGLYAFIFVPVTVGFVKPNLLEQQNFLFRLRRKCRFFKVWLIENLKQSVRTFCLFLICVKEFFVTLPYFYRSFITFQVITNQIVFFILSEKVFAPENHLLSLYLLIFFTILIYVKTCLEPRFRMVFEETYFSILFNSTFAKTSLKVVVSVLFLLSFIKLFYNDEPPLLCVLFCSMYYGFTEQKLEGEDMLTTIVSFFQSDIFEQLEHLYIPLFIRLLCIISSLVMCLMEVSKFPLLVTMACYTNIYVPFTRLSSEILSPLEQEIKGLHAFRQATQEELAKAGKTCPVCLDEMHVARITNCGHVFHSHCLRQCLLRSPTCPCCRAKIM